MSQSMHKFGCSFSFSTCLGYQALYLCYVSDFAPSSFMQRATVWSYMPFCLDPWLNIWDRWERYAPLYRIIHKRCVNITLYQMPGVTLPAAASLLNNKSLNVLIDKIRYWKIVTRMNQFAGYIIKRDRN